MQYSMTCTCGHVETVEAASRDEAVKKLQDMWTEDAIAKHMAEKHPGEPVITKAQSDAVMVQMVQPAT